MSTYKSVQQTKITGVPMISIGPSELGGRERIAHFDYLTEAIVYPGQTIDLTTLPQSARILGGEVKFEDMSTNITETADDDYFFADAAMHNGAYTLLHTTQLPVGTPRQITCFQTAVDGEDTNGTLYLIGTDGDDAALTEILIPNAAATVTTVGYFKTITSITGGVVAGVGGTIDWVTNCGADTIKIGYKALTGVEAMIEIGISSDSNKYLAATSMTSAGVAEFANTIALNYGERLGALNATKIIAKNPISESEPWAAAKIITGFMKYVVD